MNIQVIEYFPEDLPGRVIRKERWVELKKDLQGKGINITIPTPRLDSEGRKHNNVMAGEDGKPFSFEGYHLTFIHKSDDDGYTYQATLDESNIKPFVCYSAEPAELRIDRLSSLLIDFLPFDLFEKNITAFFERLIFDRHVTVEALYKLIGFDPSLEARLELLHMCLTPEKAGEVFKGKFPATLNSEKEKVWTTTLRSLNPNLRLDAKHTHLEDLTVAALSEHLSKIADCFSDEYIAALSALRRALLEAQLTPPLMQ
jgi:hypothetical protein